MDRPADRAHAVGRCVRPRPRVLGHRGPGARRRGPAARSAGAHDVVSTAHAEGIEDRATHAPLAARRLAEQVAIGERIAALELGAAAQAAELRGHALGAGTTRGLALVRDAIPFLAAATRSRMRSRSSGRPVVGGVCGL